MKLTLLVILIVMLGYAPVYAQGGHIGLYADTWGSSCAFETKSYEVLEVHVVHMSAPGITASQFAVESGGGFTGTYMGEELGPEVVALFGNSRTGISIAYGDCFESPLHLLTIRYLIEGTSPEGSYLKVVDDPTAYPPGKWVVDCSFGPLLPATGGIVFVNETGIFCCASTPVVAKSWGAIKALYE